MDNTKTEQSNSASFHDMFVEMIDSMVDYENFFQRETD